MTAPPPPAADPLVVVVGPTAAGKSEIAVELALRLNGEIISADSVQVYRYLDIGTARITPGQQKGVPHHLLGFLEPDEEFTVAQYQKLARAKIREIAERGRLPFLVGGTGLYVQAVIDPYDFPPQGGLDAIRRQLRSDVDAGRTNELYAELRSVDPDAAGRIHPNDHRRITRALEVYRLTGRTISSFQDRDDSRRLPYRLVMVGIDRSRAELYRRIERRVDRMFQAGLVEEVKDLIDRGFQPSLKPLQTLGYRQVAGYLEGAYDLETTVALVKKATRNYAKRQLTWFRRDPRIKWFLLENGGSAGAVDEIEAYICRSLSVYVE
jgi:tRNA dimethylallyltransferase